VRIGHTVEAQILEELCVDFIDESEVLTPADEEEHIYKSPFKIPFVCGARNLGIFGIHYFAFQILIFLLVVIIKVIFLKNFTSFFVYI
jgi:hypothetical protein